MSLFPADARTPEGERGVEDPITVREVEHDMFPEDAVIDTVPSECAVADPVSLKDATLVSDEDHSTDAVRSIVVPSK